ncbi:MAG: hypothetical protein H7321_05580 [Bacteroidia bacterium]|nr:hypothetical protein [Bacteroidia bacterium]
MSDVKKFFKKALILLPLPLIFFGTSYLIDPSNRFQNGAYEKGLANELIKGNNVLKPLNCDERLLQKYFVSEAVTRPDWLVLGSSHAMQIHSRHVNGTLMNNSVSAAVLEDILAITNLHETHKGLPENIIISVDAWLFNANTGNLDWSSYADDYYNMCKKIGIKEPHKKESPLKKYKELFSPSYFKNSYEFLLEGKNKKFTLVTTQENEQATRLYDGSLEYDQWQRNADTTIINQKATWFTENTPVFMFWGYSELSSEIKTNFDFYLDHLQKEGSKITFFLAPYHPIVQNHFNKNN